MVGAVGIEPTTSPVGRERSAKKPNKHRLRPSRSPWFDTFCSGVSGAKAGRLFYHRPKPVGTSVSTEVTGASFENARGRDSENSRQQTDAGFLGAARYVEIQLGRLDAVRL